ncbi:MAG: metallophosphoesterase [Bacteroidales bacterium]|nr:metallophosphoesterase [Fournierella massiliensis]MCF2556249.1 metallophosphoesterase [Fournierella massiliensis]MCI6739503.1 metallophosphoesterase [Bacteroidales bacterium]
MAIFVIADLHLSLGAADKPMDVFEGWQGYLPKLERNWRTLIAPEDTVVLPGDISWAMSLEDTREDFAFLNALPGKKIILKGNHDYWWTTLNKMNRFLEVNGFDTLQILHNTAIQAEGVFLCGTRGWMSDVQGPEDEKILNREIGRLRMSLEAAGEGEKLAFLHYPPLYPGQMEGGLANLLKEFGVSRCFYGHLHGVSIRYAVQGEHDGVDYRLISADALKFCPYKIR